MILCMERAFLESCLANGMSLEAIGELVGKHPSTVSYHLKKHGLAACHAAKYAPRGGIPSGELEALIEKDLTLSAMAERLGRSVATVRYWLARHGLNARRDSGATRTRAGNARRAAFECKRHGHTDFVLEGRGYYRCMRCRSEAVMRRRRRVKEILVEEAGGKCRICGYDRCMAALQFHHLDPSEKEFVLSLRGVTRSIGALREEASKCVLLCANCHAEVEAEFTALEETPVTE
jgi:DNA-binding transcriptional ArsR family regulator